MKFSMINHPAIGVPHGTICGNSEDLPLGRSAFAGHRPSPKRETGRVGSRTTRMMVIASGNLLHSY